MTTRRLLPEGFFRPALILLLWAVPMVLLLCSNVFDWLLVREHLSREETFKAAGMGAWNVILIALALACGLRLWIKRQNAGTFVFALMLVGQLGFLFYAVFLMPHPDGVEYWILSPARTILAQFTGCMPAVFYATLYFACFPRMRSGGMDIAVSLGGCIVTPFLMFLGGYVLVTLFDMADSEGSFLRAFALLLLLTSCTFALGVFVLRLVTMLFLRLRNTAFVRGWGMACVVALVLPYAGLALNAVIPFPVDFQSVGVYVFTLVNALLLMIPARGQAAPWVWTARWACFPFTLYFFAVFLPFLPLSIPAIFAAGGGFLILAPTFLFIFHLLKLREAYGECRQATAPRRPWGKGALVALALVGASLGPLCFLGESFHYRRVLRAALAYVCSPDTAQPMRFADNPNDVLRALDWLTDYKNGNYLPLITPLRGKILFNGMVLPDERMQDLYGAFGAGKSIGQLRPDRPFHIFPTIRRRFEDRVRAESPLSTHPLAVKCDSATETTGSFSKTRVSVLLTNRGIAQAEFRATLKLSPGVEVTGVSLVRGATTLRADIFEEKSALWVYRMIRKYSQRDPILVRYGAPDELRLMVFPVNGHQSVRAELELTYPAGFGATATLTEAASEKTPRAHTVLDERDDARIFLADGPQGRAALCARWDRHIPGKPVNREPVVRLLVDRSAQGACSTDDIRKAIDALAAVESPQREARVDFLNYQMTPCDGGATRTLEAWRAYFDGKNDAPLPPAQGGLLMRQAALHIGWDYLHTALKKDGDFLRYPKIVVATRADLQPDDFKGPWPFAELMPEAPLPLIFRPQNVGNALQGAPMPVQFVALGDAVRPVACDRRARLLYFPEGGQTLGYWDADARAWRTLPEKDIQAFQGAWAEGALNYASALRTRQNPSTRDALLPEILQTARATGALVPLTAYIAVDTAAQREKLRRAQQQAFDSPGELEFAEMPEPSVLVLGAGALALGWWITRRKRGV